MNTTDPKASDFAGPCPRCGGGIPNDTQPGAYPGALSRLDNATYICSDCGTREALWQFARATKGESAVLPPFGVSLLV